MQNTMKRLRRKDFNSGQLRQHDGKSLGQLLEFLASRDGDKQAVKSGALEIIQLVFDGMIERGGNWGDKLRLLEKLMEMGTSFIGDYYRNRFHHRKVASDILDISGDILRYGDLRNPSKSYHLSWSQGSIYGRVREYQDMLMVPNVIIPVASEGFEPAFLFASIYDCASVFPMRFSPTRSDKKVMVARGTPGGYLNNLIEGQRVLVVEGTVKKGRSLSKVCQKVLAAHPSELEFCTMQGSADGIFSDGNTPLKIEPKYDIVRAGRFNL